MMKKTIGLLAALMITMSSMGVTASGAEFFYTGDEDSSYSQSSSEKLQEAIRTGDSAGERKAVKEIAMETCDPGYYKAMRMQNEFERNAGGGRDSDVSDAEDQANTDLMKRTLKSTSTYIKYIDSYITHNSCFDNSTKTIGIDVSEWQYTIDWNKVKADGIQYAIIRVGYRGWGSAGTLVMDEYFRTNLANAKAAGIKVGVYFYTQAISTSEARAEARYVLNALNGTYLDYPVYYDIEAVGNGEARLDCSGLSKQAKSNLCRAFCEEIEAGGYTAGVYSYRNYFYSDVDGAALANEYPVWLADYTSPTPYTGAYHMWQFQSTAIVNGINGGCDINVCYGDDNLGGKGTATSVSELAKPANLSKSGNLISWDIVTGATGYEVSLHNTDKGTYSAIGKTTGTNYSVKNPNATYPYCVRAYNDTGDAKVYSPYSEDIYLGDDRISGLTTTLGDGSITLKWNKDNDATGYYIYRSADGTEFVKIGETSTLSYVDSSISSTVSKYHYYIQGFNASGLTKKSDAVTVYLTAEKSKPPVINSCTANSVTVTWNEVNGVSGYQLLEYNPSTQKYVVKGDVKTGSDRRYTFTGLEAGTSYKFCIRTYISASNGDKKFGEFSDDLSAKTMPPAVTGLTSSATSTGVKLKWTAAKGAEKYVVYRKTSDGYKKLGTLTGTSVNIKMSGNEVRQYCVAGAIEQGGKEYIGANSSLISVTSTGIGTPTINSGSYSNNSITLTWSKADNADGYRLYKYDAASKTYKSIKTLSGATKTSYTVTNIQSGITEIFKVKAFKRNGSEVKWGAASAAFSVKTLAPLPAPTDLYATATDSNVTLTWKAVEGASLYNVYEVNGSSYDLLGEVNTNGCKLTGGAGSGRTFAVSAVSQSGSTKTAGEYSKTAVVSKTPGVPTLSAASKTANSIKLSWTVPSGASGVRIYMYNATKKTYVSIKTLSNKKNTLNITSLNSGSTYKFKAKAYIKTSTGISWGKATSAFSVKTN